jgi:hypothetical protein
VCARLDEPEEPEGEQERRAPHVQRARVDGRAEAENDRRDERDIEAIGQ